MPAITFDRFDGGLDVRQLASSADANRLRTLKNAYVTTGRTIRKRPGLRKVADLPTGCKGLFSGLDALWTFSGRTVDYVENVSNAVLSVDADITDVLNVEVFNGYLYLCAKHRNGMTQHYYLDGRPDGAAIVDEHCPHSAGFIKKAGKIFACFGILYFLFHPLVWAIFIKVLLTEWDISLLLIKRHCLHLRMKPDFFAALCFYQPFGFVYYFCAQVLTAIFL